MNQELRGFGRESGLDGTCRGGIPLLFPFIAD